MKFKNLLLLLFGISMIFSAIGCGEPKNMIDQNSRVGMTPQERKDKRGE